MTGADWDTSGVADLLLAQGHRVVIFDRPAFGYSDRPRGRIWTAARQADLLHKALRQLGVERPVVVAAVAVMQPDAVHDDERALRWCRRSVASGDDLVGEGKNACCGCPDSGSLKGDG